MGAVRMVRLERRRAEPHVVVESGGNRFGLQVGFPDPLEFPVEARRRAEHDLERPSQQARLDDFFHIARGHSRSVDDAFEAEPGVDAENPSVAPDRLDHFLAFGDGARHRLFAPDVLAGLGGGDGNRRVPVRRGWHMHDVDVGPVERLAEILVSLRLGSGELQRLSQTGFVDVAHGQDDSALVIPDMDLAHAAAADHGAGQRFARRRVAGPAQHMARDDGEDAGRGGRLRRALEEAAPGYLRLAHRSILVPGISPRMNALSASPSRP
ncbi:MAG: hypothetical protein BWZ10_02103 [candidate division BRC1 bacterium ADurb.BinA364]|nr:MAG: hypothetical protein BWZ10_02103 [candidate division BRC1 bacterium ADurb.BinA364]